jgi:Capsule assembly protein Wzi
LPVFLRRTLPGLLLLVWATSAHAQRERAVPVATLGDEQEERRRLLGLLDSLPAGSSDVLLRSASRFQRLPSPLVERGALRWRVLLPEAAVVYNSALPNGGNDGALRAGRGMNLRITGGLEVVTGAVRLRLAPELMREENKPYQVLPFAPEYGPRSVWANPFHRGPESIDLPLRFGDDSHARLDLGQSSLTAAAGRFELGVATENVWWGPGLRNALVLSNNAAGFPHFLVRLPAPIATRIGLVGFDALAGRLQESGFFDADPQNDRRSIAGGAVTWQRDTRAGLQLGVAAQRIAGVDGADYLSSLLGRWRFAPYGLEIYAEWARFLGPRSVRDFLEFPTHAEGYTYGVQWARPLRAGRLLALHGEITTVEPTPSLAVRPVRTSYTSVRVPQGFTQRGEVLGASIGPGSSSQWLAADVFGTGWRLGGFGARTRYDNGALYSPYVPPYRAPDVTLRGFPRGA